MSHNIEDLNSFIRNMQPVLSNEQVIAIASYFSPKGFLKGDLFLKEKDIAEEYCIVTSGVLRSYTINREGEEVTTGLYDKGTIACNLSSFFKRSPSLETFVVMCDSRGWIITFDKLQEAFHALPFFREFGRAVLVNEYALLKNRSLAGLHQSAEERYAELVTLSPDIVMNVPLKNIASYLGITDTSLSRIRKEFSKK